MPPHLDYEWQLRTRGHHTIAGVDEVGRGCWAGPVVAAAVVLSDAVLHMPAFLQGLNDSKQLSASQRNQLVQTIQQGAVGIGIGWVAAHDVDCFGILTATKLAMQQAVMSLPLIPDALLIDAVTLPAWAISQQALIKGDATSLSIAAASVIAKVARDRMMLQLGIHDRRYGFSQHKGYGTAQHQQALRRYGITAQHRQTFRPISTFLATGQWDDDADDAERSMVK
jgi:ribonuclease HII